MENESRRSPPQFPFLPPPDIDCLHFPVVGRCDRVGFLNKVDRVNVDGNIDRQ